jgi:hypothetical protein
VVSETVHMVGGIPMDAYDPALARSSSDQCWPIRDNLRNFFLSPSAEVLSFFQQLRETV